MTSAMTISRGWRSRLASPLCTGSTRTSNPSQILVRRVCFRDTSSETRMRSRRHKKKWQTSPSRGMVSTTKRVPEFAVDDWANETGRWSLVGGPTRCTPCARATIRESQARKNHALLAAALVRDSASAVGPSLPVRYSLARWLPRSQTTWYSRTLWLGCVVVPLVARCDWGLGCVLCVVWVVLLCCCVVGHTRGERDDGP
mmetsp:Transcript_26359/g.76854  ORF Transcript_26359/g.76854 Transcript_26359/m.76854 type:complete len:200 (-) Transcript_26359:33-632(-)